MASPSNFSGLLKCLHVATLASASLSVLLASDDDEAPRTVRRETSPPPLPFQQQGWGHYAPGKTPSSSSSGKESPAFRGGVGDGVPELSLPHAASSRPSSAPFRVGSDVHPPWKNLARCLASHHVLDRYDWHPLLEKLFSHTLFSQDRIVWPTLVGIYILFGEESVDPGDFEDRGMQFLREIKLIPEPTETHAAQLRAVWTKRNLGCRVGWELSLLRDVFSDVKARAKSPASKKAGKTSPDPEASPELSSSRTDMHSNKIDLLVDPILSLIDARVHELELLRAAESAAQASDSPVNLGMQRQATEEFPGEVPDAQMLLRRDDTGGGLAQQPSDDTGGGLRYQATGGGLSQQPSDTGGGLRRHDTGGGLSQQPSDTGGRL